LFEHDLFGKPVSTFPDHALESPNNLAMTSQNPIETEACALPLTGLGVWSSDFDKIGTDGVFAVVRRVK
jgi:hypothetical protein